MGDYTEHLITQAGGDGDKAGRMSGMAEVLKVHRIDSYQNAVYDETRWICTNNACDFETDNWSGNLAEDRIAEHHAAMLTAAGFGKLS